MSKCQAPSLTGRSAEPRRAEPRRAASARCAGRPASVRTERVMAGMLATGGKLNLRKRLVRASRFVRGRRCVSAARALLLLPLLVCAFVLFWRSRGDAPPPAAPWSHPSKVIPAAPGVPLPPPEAHPPSPKLYGTGSERCFMLGRNEKAAKPNWHMNSRALCSFDAPVCLHGGQLQNVYTFAPRGTGSCDVVSVNGNTPTVRASADALGESCAAFRKRHVIGMLGKEQFAGWEPFLHELARRKYKDPEHRAASWHSDFAIIVPKYPWSWNICHYNRIWLFVAYVLRNLRTFAPKAVGHVTTVDVLFRSGLHYTGKWPAGLRESTIPALESETGLKIRVGQLRWDYKRDFQCIRKGILLGDEGRVDSFPFLNDTNIWNVSQHESDSHWPDIPESSLWLRNAIYNANGFGDAARFDGPGVSNFRSIPVPPKRIAYLQRSPFSPRRLTPSGSKWLEDTLHDLAAKHGFEVRYVRFRKEMAFKDQVAQVRDVGLAVGLHGANMVNTMFMPAGAAMFELFPWRYVRYYYAAGLNSGLRYSYHEPENGVDKHCNFDKYCFMRYRESVIYLSEVDRQRVRRRIEKALIYIAELNDRFANGSIPLEKTGKLYRIPKPPARRATERK